VDSVVNHRIGGENVLEEPRPEVFAYLDYRVFLSDTYAVGRRRGISYRWLARRAGIRSPSFLKHVIDGKRSLATATAVRVAKAFGLTGEAVDYFAALVLFNQATEASEERAAYARIRRFRRFREVQSLGVARDAYHAHWYLPAIRELAVTDAFRDDPAWIAARLRPRISVREARAALATLEALGLLSRDAHGAQHATHEQVATEPRTQSIHLATYHRAMMERASAAIDECPREERDLSSITLAVDPTGLEALRRRIQDIRADLLDEFDAGERGVQVVQVNFQLFPLSERVDEQGP
jgi:uncharacterized protein (TIGR02147 family)